MSGPGFVSATAQVADLGLRQTLRSRLLIGVGLIILFAVGLALIIGQADDAPGAAHFQGLQILVLSPVVVPLIALLLGTGAMATERESGTLSYLFARPFPRAAVVLGKGLAAIAAAGLAVLLCVVLVWAASGAPADGQLLGGALALLLESTALTAVFVLFGTLLARSLFLGLAYAVLFEGAVGNSLGARSGWTLTYHARKLLTEWSADGLQGEAFAVALPGSTFASVLVLLLATGGALAVAAYWVEKREYGLKDRPKEE